MKKGKVKEYLKNPSKFKEKIRWILAKNGFYNSWSDEKYLSYKYKLKYKRKLNLNSPTLYTEKLQWLKIHDHNPIYTKMVDKYDAKDYIKEVVGEKYVIPTYGIYNSFDEIDFDKLPNEFIIKCTHNSGGVIVCNNKKTFDIQKSKKIINNCLKYNHYYLGREWPYKSLKPRIIVEELLKNNDGSELVEYNLFCFNGEPKIVMTCHGDKRIKRYNDFYDIDFNKIDLKCEYDNSDIIDKKPHQFEEMINISKKISKVAPQLRVDLYVCNDRIYVGELTFFHWGGFGKFEPNEWDEKMGNWLSLPIERKK